MNRTVGLQGFCPHDSHKEFFPLDSWNPRARLTPHFHLCHARLCKFNCYRVHKRKFRKLAHFETDQGSVLIVSGTFLFATFFCISISLFQESSWLKYIELLTFTYFNTDLKHTMENTQNSRQTVYMSNQLNRDNPNQSTTFHMCMT